MTDFVYATKDHLWRIRTSQKKSDDGDCIRYILVGDKWLPISQMNDYDAQLLRKENLLGLCPNGEQQRHEHGLPFLT